MDYDLDTLDGMLKARAWLIYLIATVRDGAIWGVPRSNSFYKLDKTKKIATKITGGPEPSIERVFAEIGWTVQETMGGEPAG